MRAGFAGLAAGLTVVALFAYGRDSQASPQAGRKLISIGVSLTIPRGWHGRAFVTYGEPVLQAANFSLAATGDANGSDAIRQIRSPEQVFLLLEEVGNQPGTGGFDRESLPIQLHRGDFITHPSGVPVARVLARRHFSTAGRSFSLLVYFGRQPVPPARVREVNKLLSSLTIQRLLPKVAWRRLARPLRLPQLANGSRCPRSPSSRAAPRVYFTLGHGPAYPVLGSGNGVADLTGDTHHGRFYLHKTLWAISPSYGGPVLVRGRRIDGTEATAFSLGSGAPQNELRLPPIDAGRQWRYAPSTTFIASTGCYAFQIDGNRFSYVLVYQARLFTR